MKKRRGPLKFALGLAGASGLILAIPLVGPRLLAGSKWDEPDVKPVLKVDEPGSYLKGLSWSRDGKRLSYFVESYANHSWDQGTLTRVERAWPEMKEVSRREVLEGNNRALWDYLATNLAGGGWGSPQSANHVGDLSLTVDNGRWVQRRTPSGRVITAQVGLRLRLLREGRLLRSWSLPDGALGTTISHTPLLSPDGKLAMVVACTRDYNRARRSGSEMPYRDLWEVLGADEADTLYQCSAYRVSDGRLVLSRRFSNKMQGLDARGGLWMQRLEYQGPLLFDGRALWFALSPYHLPKDAQPRFKEAKALVARGFPMPAAQANAFENTVQKVRSLAQFSNELVLFDALSGHARSFSPPELKLVAGQQNHGWMLERNLSWDTSAFSDDRSLLVARLSGSGSTAMLNELGSGTLCVWDYASGRPLWKRAAAEGTWINHAQFSPDKRMLAYAVGHSSVAFSSTFVVVAEARTGKVIGPPLLEESPRQRFEESRARWQQPLQSGVRDLSSTFASATPTPAPQASDGFTGFYWSPDSRSIVSIYKGARIKVWRIPSS